MKNTLKLIGCKTIDRSSRSGNAGHSSFNRHNHSREVTSTTRRCRSLQRDSERFGEPMMI